MNLEPLYSDFADDEDMAEIIEEFIIGMAITEKTLLTSLETGDTEQVRTIGHQMKGAGASYGFDAITDAGAELEHAVVNDSDEVEAKASALIALFRRARAGVDSLELA